MTERYENCLNQAEILYFESMTDEALHRQKLARWRTITRRRRHHLRKKRRSDRVLFRSKAEAEREPFLVQRLEERERRA